MNAEQLLAHYERVAEAPDAITRLRRFVLDLAIRGKLIEQNEADEPANALLARAKRERDQATKSGVLRQTAHSESISPDQKPFHIPLTWEWARFADLAAFAAGRTPPRHDSSYWNSGDHAWVSIADMVDGEDLTSTKETVSAKAASNVFSHDPVPPGTMIMSFKLTIGKIARLAIPAFHNEAIISIRPFEADLDPYLFKVLPQFARMGDTKGAIKGATLNRGSISNILIPLPPLAEQHRIVAKVDELMALCDRLEAARAQREATRDRLTASTLARLNTPEPPASSDGDASKESSFQSDASFALKVLPALTARPDQIKQLRQAIFDLAVCGRLVSQKSDDEPFRDFLTRSQRDQNRCDATRFQEIPAAFQSLPRSWLWTHLGDLVLTMDAGWSPQCDGEPRGSEAEWGVLKTTAVQALAYEPHQNKKLPEQLQPRPQHEAKIGDILVTRAGPKNRVGVSCVVDKPSPRLMISDKLIRFHTLDGIFPRYIALALNAGFTMECVERAKSGMAVMQMNISQDKLKLIPLPMPPLAEQHRIVAKVDELMTLCDQLEASLSRGENTRSRLLNALLHEALAPAESVLEAA